MTSVRKSISKSTRFTVFSRDKFTCQYCGAKAPDVLLEIEHILPVARGGTNDLMNLTTACKGCNSGKSDRLLGDDTAVRKRRSQLDASQDKREQLEMMARWQRELEATDDRAVEEIAGVWNRAAQQHELCVSAGMRSTFRRLLLRHSLCHVMAASRYVIGDNPTTGLAKDAARSVLSAAMGQLEARVRYEKRCEADPFYAENAYNRGILT